MNRNALLAFATLVLGSCHSNGLECSIDSECTSDRPSCVSNRCKSCEGACDDPGCDSKYCGAGNLCWALSCVPSHCASGQKDGDETDVDCGGSCAARCGVSQHCQQNADCVTGFCTGGLCVESSSCKQILATWHEAPDAVYTIKPASAAAAFLSYCRMTPVGGTDAAGGWTLVQTSAFAGSPSLRTDYATFYGTAVGTPHTTPGASSSFRVPAKYWAELAASTSNNHLVVDYARRSGDHANCSARYFIATGTWNLPEPSPSAAPGVTNISQSRDGWVFDPDDPTLPTEASLSTTDLGPRQDCLGLSFAKGIPWTYRGSGTGGSACGPRRPEFQGDLTGWVSPRPTTNTQTIGNDMLNKSVADVCGTAGAVQDGDYVSLNAMDYFVR